jgi:putative tricarboxylic transport membrane protein
MSEKRKLLSGNQRADLVVLIALSGLVVWYFLDAYNASTHVLNLIIILPLTGMTLLLCLIQFVRQLLDRSSEQLEVESVRAVFPVISIFVAYTMTLPWLGFDVGTGIFIAVFLWLNGDAVCFASIVSLFFGAMLPYPMPMLVFPS